jgi:hypothetical protein
MNRHNGTVGYRGYSNSEISNTQRNALTQINCGWTFTNTDKGVYTLTTFKSLASRGLITLSIEGKNWTATKVGA